MKKALGYFLISIPFIVLLAHMVKNIGIIHTLIIVIGSTLTVGLILVGVYLIIRD